MKTASEQTDMVANTQLFAPPSASRHSEADMIRQGCGLSDSGWSGY
jgi:hypothetical protein